MPTVIAFYIVSPFYRNTTWKATFSQHYNYADDTFNLYNENYKIVKVNVIKLPRIKYVLEIINEDSLYFKKIEH